MLTINLVSVSEACCQRRVLLNAEYRVSNTPEIDIMDCARKLDGHDVAGTTDLIWVYVSLSWYDLE